MKKIKKENANLISRLNNFKFNSALQYLNGEERNVKSLVEALSVTFGDCGWMLRSAIGVIISAAINSILPEPEENEEE